VTKVATGIPGAATGTPAGTFAVQVTVTAGSTQHSIAVTLAFPLPSTVFHPIPPNGPRLEKELPRKPPTKKERRFYVFAMKKFVSLNLAAEVEVSSF